MKGLSKIFPLVFLLIFGIVVSNFVIFQVISVSQKKLFREELLKNVDKYEVKTISRALLYKDKNGLEWKDGNKEVCFFGEFYEIIKIENTENSDELHLYLVKDIKENKFFADYFNGKENNSDYILSMVKLFFSLQLPGSFNIEYRNSLIVKQKHIASLALKLNNDSFGKLIKPPIV